MYTEYPEDCIHLKACRRATKILKNHLNAGTRKCNYCCNAYESKDDLIKKQRLYTHEQVEDVKYGACMDGHSGYYPKDLLIEDYIK